MKAAIYIRVSTQEQVENYSIDSQKERIEAFCKSKGWSIFDTYIDGGYSGSTMDRPALQKMLNELNEIDVVVVYKLDRLSRSQRDTLTLIEEHFLKSEVDFVSLTETIDTSTPFGKAMIGILSVFAQLERETIAERMRMGHIKRAEEGLRGMGGNHNPSGYIRSNGYLEVNEEEAEHIRLMFDLYEQYHSIAKAQAKLKEMGEPVWRFRRYRDILSNRLYLGEVSFAGKYYKGQHPAIVSEEQFDRVQNLLERHAGRNKYRAKESLFSNLITCGCCGEPYMSYQSNCFTKSKGRVTYRYYMCKARRFPAEYPKKCMNKTWNSKTIEELVVNELKRISLDKKEKEKKVKTINYPSLIKKVDEKVARIISLYAEGNIDKPLLDNQIKKLDDEKRKLIQAQKRQLDSDTLSPKQLDQYVLNLSEVEFSEKQAIINKLIDQIIIENESVKIEWAI
ncbi:recombinase family protein [Alkalihalophilus marmarensis]|uniref:recombinase family protein n=1 Tax=Alkalihalophilus marmarensis TaxID=521377 RepID=UPI002E1FB86D|nr:recombinase family protein [Alkalihalophilus marmarensis]